MQLVANVKWVWFLHTDVFERPIISINTNRPLVTIMDTDSILCEVEMEVFHVV
jgi:hypothetical protein